VQTSYGVGVTRDKLGLLDRLFFALLLAPQIADTERQEQAVTTSGLDWVLVQPVHLTDAGEEAPPHVSAAGALGRMKVARASVGRVLADAVESPHWVGRCLAVSSAPKISRALAPPAR
jgi:uncharacterized protein YbjT (DUF2867 family)